MSAIYEYFYETIGLKTMGIGLGMLLLAAYSYALISGSRVRERLKKFPRNRKLGVILLAIDAVWAFLVISNMDLGEFFTIRRTIQFAIPVAFFLVITQADEFLAVRALGVFLLLAACPVLEAAFLEEPASRILLPILAYACILKGLFWVGMPYLMRDGVDWISANPVRWKAACSAGAAYGLALLICAFAFY